MRFILIGLWLIVGIIAGIAHFTGIWWSAQQFAEGGQVTKMVALSMLRLVLLGGLLLLASFQGAPSLLAMALGVVAARFGVMRRLREQTP